MRDDDAAVRYWAVLGFAMRGRDQVLAARGILSAALDDASPQVRIAAAFALASMATVTKSHGPYAFLPNRPTGSKNDVFVAVDGAQCHRADLAIEPLCSGRRFGPVPTRGPAPDPRYDGNVAQLVIALKEKFP